MPRKSGETAKRHRSGAVGATAIPVFSLYGETQAVDDSEFVHIEHIRTRSELYDWRIGPHQHRGLFQTLFVLRGAVELRMDGRLAKVKAPCALSIPPGVVHAFRFRSGTHGYVLTVSDAMLPQGRHRALIEDLFVEPRVMSFADAPRRARPIAELLEQILVESRDNAPGHAALQEWLVNAVLLLIARERAAGVEDRHRGRRQRDFSRFRALVETHFREHWTVGRYAGALQMTEARLNRLTYAIAGKSAFDLIQDRLLLEARRRLIYIAAPISMLAYELGFEDPAYFSRYFKKRIGKTPSAFRREAR
jgi:AraC family transcriptional activator of pobA